MEKKTMIAAAALILLLIVSSNELTRVESQGVDCYDSCSTGCVNSDSIREQKLLLKRNHMYASVLRMENRKEANS
ncbi:hypothetical protein Ccrd_010623 [Cynara cardunculus var. scolymus]|uniref:Uncharacterized protein n=1 Tax=Cynara cardunculus var. scolymus TaxID=59895 RepID=A0A124SHX8_CYNCS|nr:hypothetical protein Ccrd_010623 [Cynara cardunculus var. scolymus]